jgi:NAD(P)-dependent dehydrogenase (short-subunit alcohol dehydrogenase family)
MVNIDLNGKVALVTGGSRGLGKAICLGLADAGADIIVASRKLDNCEAVATQVTGKGRAALAVSAHTGDTTSLDNLVARSIECFGKVDILVNNAGINPGFGPLTELSPEVFQKMYEVNQMGPWYLASRLAPKMAAGGGGSIINIVSVGGLRPSAMQGFYAATKAALNALTRTMAAEWAGDNIRVNAIAPGSYHSDMMASAASIPGYFEGAAASALQKRIAATEEILGPVLYLASDMGSFTTGTTIVADGGYLAT